MGELQEESQKHKTFPSKETGPHISCLPQVLLMGTQGPGVFKGQARSGDVTQPQPSRGLPNQRQKEIKGKSQKDTAEM